MNEWHQHKKDDINRKMLTFVVLLGAGTCGLILFALVSAHAIFVFA